MSKENDTKQDKEPVVGDRLSHSQALALADILRKHASDMLPNDARSLLSFKEDIGKWPKEKALKLIHVALTRLVKTQGLLEQCANELEGRGTLAQVRQHGREDIKEEIAAAVARNKIKDVGDLLLYMKELS